MGLISLPVLNKISNSNYWNNIWDSSQLFKRYFYLSLFINKFFNLLFLDYSLYLINTIILKKQIKKGYFIENKISKKINKNILLGKIWILKYQKWFIISVKLFSTKIIKKKKKLVRLKYKEKLFFYHQLKNDYSSKKINFMNYKNKF